LDKEEGYELNITVDSRRRGEKRGLLPNNCPGLERIIPLSAASQTASKRVKFEKDDNKLQDIQNVYDK